MMINLRAWVGFTFLFVECIGALGTGNTCVTTYLDTAIKIECRGFETDKTSGNVFDYLPSVHNYTRTHGILLLSNNQINLIPEDVFQTLDIELVKVDLSYNNIRGFSEKTFKEMYDLKWLDISHNPLCFNEETFPMKAFNDLVNLEVLRLVSTTCHYSVIEYYPDRSFGVLGSLKEMYLRGIHNNHLGEGFSRMRSLEKLVFTGKHCKFGNLSHESVANVQNIKEFSVINCGLKRISPSTFHNFTKMATLNMACNKELGLTQAIEGVSGVPEDTLENLVLDGLSHDAEEGKYINTLDPKLLCHKNLRSVRKLSIRSSYIFKVNFYVAGCLPMLKHFSIGFNTIMNTVPNDNVNASRVFARSVSLEVLDVSHNNAALRHIFRQVYCDEPQVYEDFFQKIPDITKYDLPKDEEIAAERENSSNNSQHSIHVPPNVKYILAQSFAISPWTSNGPFQVISPNNSVVFLNLSQTSMSQSAIENISVGFGSLRVLDLSLCGIESIPEGQLCNFPKLTHLYLASNRLGYRILNLGNILRGMHNLKWLDLSKNRLKQILHDDFADLHSLQRIDLSGNSLLFVKPYVVHLVHLQYIDLSQNVLVSLGRDFMKGLDELGNRSGSTILVNIGDNNFVCHCKNTELLVWINQTTVSVTWNTDQGLCRLNGKVIHGKNALINSIQICQSAKANTANKKATPVWEVFLVVVISLCVTVLAFFVTYRYRYSLIFCKIKSPFKWNGRKRIYSYNAYIMYDKADIRWVVSELVWHLEQELGLRTCLNLREKRTRLSQRENVVHSIDNSATTIAVISSAYITKSNTTFELEMAIAHNPDNIILIQISDEYDCSQIPVVLRELMKRKTVLTWPGDDTNAQDDFWSDLQNAIGLASESEV